MRTTALLLVSASFGVAHPAPKDAPSLIPSIPDGTIYYDDVLQCAVCTCVFKTETQWFRAGDFRPTKLIVTEQHYNVLPLVPGVSIDGSWIWDQPRGAVWLRRDEKDIRRQLHRYQPGSGSEALLLDPSLKDYIIRE